MNSHRTIHYGLRPAKNIERKMLCETFQRLAHFRNLNDYQYIGFGSRYFSDFSLIHKVLGIHNMISLEKDDQNKEWFMFNRPYDCIVPEFKHSNDFLPIHSWKKPVILWLDYDGTLDTTVFADILSFCTKALSGSILVITVNAEAEKVLKNKHSVFDIRLRSLVNRLGEEHVPSNIKAKDINKKNMPRIYRNILHNEICEKLSMRNGGLASENKLYYEQLFNFIYEDGAQMLTVGGIIYTQDQKQLLDKCTFSDFDFVMPKDTAYKIQVPNLTFREIHHLNQHLPLSDNPPAPFIPQKEIKQYAKIYRYFPAFAETEF